MDVGVASVKGTDVLRCEWAESFSKLQGETRPSFAKRVSTVSDSWFNHTNSFLIGDFLEFRDTCLVNKLFIIS